MTKKKLLLSAVFFTILALIVGVTLVQTRFPVRHLDLIEKHAGNFEPAFVLAVIHAESSFNPDAVSPAGAMGLMQIMEPTGEWLAQMTGVGDYDKSLLFEPETNIILGTYFLNWLWRYFDGDKTLILSGYNAGIGNVRRWLNDERFSEDGLTLSHIPFPETYNYVQRVEQRTQIYTAILWVHSWFR